MRMIPSDELHEIIRKHNLWLQGEDGGERANLSGANLSEADLSRANLSRANLSRAILREADLSGAILRVANLSGANLSGANLSWAILRWANLSGADLRVADLSRANLSRAILREADLSGAILRVADLSEADLSGANLSRAILREADLSGANLSGANLSGANLSGAILRWANLSGADLSGAKGLDSVKYDENTAFFALQCPESGAYTAYKKARGLIVELEIPADALRSSATSRKCRASKARVINITNADGSPAGDRVASDRDKDFVYVIGQTVEVPDFDTDRWTECSTGIHHFITREEAVNW